MFRSIALGGGGVRGGIMVGGLAALEKTQPLVFPDGIYGCSVGSILATAVAFNLPIAEIRTMFDNDFSMSSMMPSIGINSLFGFSSKKGLYSMDMMGTSLLKIFKKNGIDIENKTIADAPQKLYILASNMTTRKPVFLTGDVSVIDAIKCSCCLPGLFHPQILYNNVYMDGAILVHNIHTVVPQNCLVFHICRGELNLFPKQVESMTILELFGTIYESSRTTVLPTNVITFKNDKIAILQELTPAIKKEMFDYGLSTASRFLAKRAAEELK